jgi:hypothetical protein
MRLFKKNMNMYVSYRMTDRVCQGKTCVYVLKHYQGKDKENKLRYKVKIGCQAIKR